MGGPFLAADIIVELSQLQACVNAGWGTEGYAVLLYFPFHVVSEPQVCTRKTSLGDISWNIFLQSFDSCKESV